MIPEPNWEPDYDEPFAWVDDDFPYDLEDYDDAEAYPFTDREGQSSQRS